MKPDDKLYIYYVKGNVGYEDEKELGEDFLGNWKEWDSSFLFFTAPSFNLIEKFIQKRSHLELIDHFEFRYKDWQEQIDEPIVVGDIYIIPPWGKIDTQNGALLTIKLDPGLVFGSGLHPTTRDSVVALQVIKEEIRGKVVLDMGTGSGVLSIVCAGLGARLVLGVDINPLAVKTARQNVLLNNMEGRVLIALEDALDTISTPSNIIIANIHYEVLEKIVKSEDFKKNEFAILSGIMRSQKGELEDLVRFQGFEIINIWDHEFTWFTFLLSRDVPYNKIDKSGGKV